MRLTERGRLVITLLAALGYALCFIYAAVAIFGPDIFQP